MVLKFMYKESSYIMTTFLAALKTYICSQIPVLPFVKLVLLVGCWMAQKHLQREYHTTTVSTSCIPEVAYFMSNGNMMTAYDSG